MAKRSGVMGEEMQRVGVRENVTAHTVLDAVDRDS